LDLVSDSLLHVEFYTLLALLGLLYQLVLKTIVFVFQFIHHLVFLGSLFVFLFAFLFDGVEVALDLVINAVETVANFQDLFIISIVPLLLHLLIFILDGLDKVGGLVVNSGDDLDFTSVEVVNGTHPGLPFLIIGGTQGHQHIQGVQFHRPGVL
jgi:hypothetical protein